MANDKTLFDWVEDRKSTLEEMEQTDFFALPELIGQVSVKYNFQKRYPNLSGYLFRKILG